METEMEECGRCGYSAHKSELNEEGLCGECESDMAEMESETWVHEDF